MAAGSISSLSVIGEMKFVAVTKSVNWTPFNIGVSYKIIYEKKASQFK
jgi:hypothetical protein